MRAEKLPRADLCLALLIVLGSFAFSVLKAARAPITYDEAYTYLRFARLHTKDILRDYHVPNNHILHTLLVHESTKVFGPGLLAIRLPALGGAALFFVAAAFLAGRFPKQMRWLWLIAVALVPGLIDFHALSRGYALGGGLCFAALVVILKLASAPGDAQHGRTFGHFAFLVLTGVLLGWAIACVPVFALFAAAAVTTLVCFLARPLNHRNAVQALSSGCVVVLAGVCCAAPIYFGIQFHSTSWPAGVPGVLEFSRQFWTRIHGMPQQSPVGMVMALDAIVLAATAWSARLAVRRKDITAGVILTLFALILAGLSASSLLLRKELPFPRTLLFISPLMLFAVFYSISAWPALTPRIRAALCIIVLIPIGAAAVSRASLSVYYEWRSNSGIPQALAAIERDRPEGRAIRVSMPSEAYIAICAEYLQAIQPRPWLTITETWNADYLLETSLPNTTNWPGTLIWQDATSGLVVKRSASFTAILGAAGQSH